MIDIILELMNNKNMLPVALVLGVAVGFVLGYGVMKKLWS